MNPQCCGHSLLEEFLLYLIGFGGLGLALVVEKGEIRKKVEIIMYTTMRKRRAWPWKVLVRDYIKNIERWWSHFFFQFSLFVFWWSLMEKYLFTFRHWNWLSLSALTRTSVGFFRGNILFRVGKKIISKKISHRKRKCLFPVYNCYFYVKEKPICQAGNRK